MPRRKSRGTLAVALVAAGVAASAASAQAATKFTVVDAADHGSGTLRDEINAANKSNATDKVIQFNINGSGVHTIKLASPLPVITGKVKIDGYGAQKGAAPPTDTAPAKIKIVLDANGQDEGLEISGDEVEVRGLDIQNALRDGVLVKGTKDVVAGNHIGTDVSGVAPRPNWVGVDVQGSNDVVGGPEPADRNVISGNNHIEVLLDEGSGHLVQGNRIGTAADGLSALGVHDGVTLDRVDGNVVRDNLISGEDTMGVRLDAADDNTVQHNNVGTDVTGKVALPNGWGVGVYGNDNLIGGTGDSDGNVVSGNDDYGVDVGDSATGNDVQGNLVGTTAAGDAALPNEFGVRVFGATSNTIGGSADGAGNVIAGNTLDGVELLDGADANTVSGNHIGTDGAGALHLGNGRSGVAIVDGDKNQVGGTSDGEANTIAYNADDGVTVSSSDGGVSGIRNAIVGNSIHDNDDGVRPRDDDLGIDLGADGGTPNDYLSLDADAGANELQNDPDITEASVSGGIKWELDSDQSQRYQLDFYANTSCDPSGSGEGETYLGSQTANTTVNGKDDGTFTPPTPLSVGQQVTVTATKVVSGQLRSTSEFSPCERVAKDPPS